jgi:hypothetical protein
LYLQPYTYDVGYCIHSHTLTMWVIVSTAIHLRCGLLYPQPYTYDVGYCIHSHTLTMWVIVSTAIHLRCGLLYLQPYTYDVGYCIYSHTLPLRQMMNLRMTNKIHGVMGNKFSMIFSPIFQSYSSMVVRLYWSREPDYPEKTTRLLTDVSRAARHNLKPYSKIYVVEICCDCIGRWKSNYHTIVVTTD